MLDLDPKKNDTFCGLWINDYKTRLSGAVTKPLHLIIIIFGYIIIKGHTAFSNKLRLPFKKIVF